MPVKINFEKKEIYLSVSELVADELVPGTTSLAAVSQRLTAGRKAHQAYQHLQTTRHENYRREVTVHFRKEIEDYRFVIHGRIDGVIEENGVITVEELKTVILPLEEFNALTVENYPHYANQLKIYCYLLEATEQCHVQGRLIFVNLLNQAEKRLQIEYEPTEVADYIESRLRAILRRLQTIEAWHSERREMSEILQFPFEEIREYQKEFIAVIEQALNHGQDVLLSAPAGIGKTVGCLFPTLKLALATNRVIFYITSKTTQQHIVQQTLEQFNQQDGIHLRAITLQAREKSCPQPDPICHPDFCPLIAHYFEISERSPIYQELLELGNITPEKLLPVADKYQICPFELALDISLFVDVVLGDYNYVFDPQIYLRRFFAEGKKYDHLLLIIDEAPNLYQRGRDYYSETLYRDDLQRLLYECQKYIAPVFKQLAEQYQEIDAHLQELDGSWRYQLNQFSQTRFLPDEKFFQQKQTDLGDIMLEYFTYKKLNQLFQPNDPFDQFYYQFSKFTGLLALEAEELIGIFDRRMDNIGLKIVCQDPSNQLRPRIDGFYATIAMSATFEPMPFYQTVLGFAHDVQRHSFPSPFPAANRKILIIPEISTRYQHRSQAYEPIAEIIQQIVPLKSGNYIAFFPSFEFLQRVAAQLYLPDIDIIQQNNRMSEKERELVFNRLRQPNMSHLVLAVQGGIFAEGVDYPGEMLIGAFIIGPALPPYSFEQELMKQYYQEHYGAGFEYAYLFPGINRVIQSAGRVIRTPTDRGIIILIGQRFGTPYYNAHFPAYWYEKVPTELITRDVVAAVKEFWDGRDPI